MTRVNSPFSLNMWASILSGSLLTSVLLRKHTQFTVKPYNSSRHSVPLMLSGLIQRKPVDSQASMAQFHDIVSNVNLIYLVVVKQRPPTLSVSQSVCVWPLSRPLRSSGESKNKVKASVGQSLTNNKKKNNFFWHIKIEPCKLIC